MNFKKTRLEPFGIVVEPESGSPSINDIEIEDLRQLFREHHLVLVRGFHTFETTDELATYCDQWGEVCLWPFGKVLDLVQQETPEDHIFDSSYMPMHWDGMYRPEVPEYQIFHCVDAPTSGNGGRTTFSLTTLALEYASEEDLAMWKKVTATYEREMEFYNSRTTSPLITKHPHRDYAVIRYNEPHQEEKGEFINPPNMRFDGIADDQQQALHASLRKALYDPRSFYAHEWQTGDVVITDNFTLLHGREAFTSHTPRHLRRVQVNSNPPFNNPNLESYKNGQ